MKENGICNMHVKAKPGKEYQVVQTIRCFPPFDGLTLPYLVRIVRGETKLRLAHIETLIDKIPNLDDLVDLY